MHIYEKDGKSYYSVTTVLHVLGSDVLMKWANSMGFRHIDSEKYTEDKAIFGTLVHSGLQKIVDPTAEVEEVQPKDSMHAFDANKCYDSFERLLAQHEYKTIYTEKTLISHTIKTAGTLDWLAELDGKVTLIDFKTSKQVTFKHFLQISAYMKLLEEEEGIIIERAAICLVNDNKSSFTFFSKELLDIAYLVFEKLNQFFQSKIELEAILKTHVANNTLPNTVLS